jgi:ketosteroid isomerase-like protein
MSRTPEQVFQHHAEALGAEDLDEIAADYAEDAVFITPDGVTRGRAGIREAFAGLLGQIPSAEWTIRTAIYEGDVMLLEWSVDSAPNRVDDGTDTFLFRDGEIVVQTVVFTLQPKG